MQSIGEDIVLLAIRGNGTIAAYEKLCFALGGWELLRLAGSGRIAIDQNGQVVVLDASPVGDALVDMALAVFDDAMLLPSGAADWVASRHPVLVNKYLERLSEAGTIRFEDRTFLGLLRIQRWIVLDEARVTDAKDRLDAIVSATGALTSEQAAFAGLVYAVGLGRWLYPGREGQAMRDRLERIAQQLETPEIAGAVSNSANSAVGTPGAVDSALQNATWSAAQSVADAVADAIVQHHQTGHGGGSHHGGGGVAGGHHG